MKFSQTAAAVAGLAGVALAADYESTVWTSVITTDYETYCPYPTTFTHHNVTYTATEETTITVTNCPCTVTCSQPPPITTTEYPTVEYPVGPSDTTTVTYHNSSSTVYTYTPPPTTYWSATEPAPYYPTHTPVPPSYTPVPLPSPSTAAGGSTTGSTGVAPIPTAGADKLTGAVGALVAAALAALAL